MSPNLWQTEISNYSSTHEETTTMRSVIHIEPSGRITFIHDDQLRSLLMEGAATLTRASHVEPGDMTRGQHPLQWYADMAPSAGPVLGPFGSRGQALDAEQAWINEHACGG